MLWANNIRIEGGKDFPPFRVEVGKRTFEGLGRGRAERVFFFVDDDSKVKLDFKYVQVDVSQDVSIFVMI